MRVQKYGTIVDIPVRAGTIVRLREGSSGKVTSQKAVVVKGQKPSDFSRAYGKQVYYCIMDRGKARIGSTGAGDLYPVGRAKRVPKACKRALAEYLMR